METEQMKKLYEDEPNKWTPYTNNRGFWEKAPRQYALIMWECNHVLIRKEHEEIADAIIANSDVEVEYKSVEHKLYPNQWLKKDNFFEDYFPQFDYQIKPTLKEVEESKVKIKKTMTETYTLRGGKCSWAKINLDCGEQTVNVMISSDYGEFNYFWGSTGYPPKKFLCSMDMHNGMKKLMGGTANMYEPDFEERYKNIKKLIIEERREDRISKDEARSAWIETKDIFEYCGNSNDVYFIKFTESNEFEKIFHDWESIPSDNKLLPKVLAFWNDVWIPFTNELMKEFAEHKCGYCKAEYTAEPNSTCRECGYVGVEYTHQKPNEIEED